MGMIKKIFVALLFTNITLAADQQQLAPLKCDSSNPEVQAKLRYFYNKIMEKYEVEDMKLEATNFIYEYEKNCSKGQSLADQQNWVLFKKNITNVKINKKKQQRQLKIQEEATQSQTREMKSNSDEALIFSNSKSKNLEAIVSERVDRRSTCTDTLNLTAPLSFENTKNQGSMGWCYAYAASDLVGHKLGHLVSPIYMAVNYNKEVGRTAEKKPDALQSSLEGGYSSQAVYASLLSGGFCSDEDLPSTHNFLTQYSGMNPFSKLFVALNGDHQLISYYLKNLEKLSKKYKKRKISDSDVASLQKKFGTSFPNLTINEMVTIIRDTEPYEVIEKLFEENCKGKLIQNKKVDHATLKVAYLDPPNETSESLKAKVDQVLNHKDIVSIAFSARVLYSKSDKSSADKDHHEVLLVGRKFDPKKNQCLYLVRNSYGPSCAQYDSSYECIKGHIWVPEENLFRSLDIVTYFDP